jgi:hypothetical protein
LFWTIPYAICDLFLQVVNRLLNPLAIFKTNLTNQQTRDLKTIHSSYRLAMNSHGLARNTRLGKIPPVLVLWREEIRLDFFPVFTCSVKLHWQPFNDQCVSSFRQTYSQRKLRSSYIATNTLHNFARCSLPFLPHFQPNMRQILGHAPQFSCLICSIVSFSRRLSIPVSFLRKTNALVTRLCKTDEARRKIRNEIRHDMIICC